MLDTPELDTRCPHCAIRGYAITQHLHRLNQGFVEAGRADLIEMGYRATANLTADFAGIDRPERTVAETELLIRLVKKFSEGATMVHSTRDKNELESEVLDALAVFDKRFNKPSVARRRTLLADPKTSHPTRAAFKSFS